MSAGLRKLPVPEVLRVNGFTRVHVQPVSNREPRDVARIYDFADDRGRWLVVRDEKYVRTTTRFAIQTVLGEHLASPWTYYVTDLGAQYRHLFICRRRPGPTSGKVDEAAAAFDAELSALLDGTLQVAAHLPRRGQKVPDAGKQTVPEQPAAR